MKTVCFGEIMLRLSPPGFERLLQTPQFVATFGGGEANVAVSLAQFGCESHYVTRLPGHAIGDAAIRVLRAEWAYLTEPARLQELSARFLDLAPVPARQMASLSELPGPMLGFAAFEPYASPYASPGGGLVPRPALLDGRANQSGEQP